MLHYLIDWGHPLPTNLNLPYWVSRSDLDAGELLPAHIMTGTEPRLLLVTDPDDRMIDRLPKAEQLRVYWRVLFQAAVMREIDRKIAAGTLTERGCLDRLERFGLPAAREIRSVLGAEHTIARDADPATRYRAFAATYLDLVVFGGHGAEDYFPSLPHGDLVVRAIGEDMDVPALLAAMRPAGAADPHREPLPDERWVTGDNPAPVLLPPGEPRGLLGRALDAEQKGNNVRAAILLTQVAASVTGEDRERALAARGPRLESWSMRWAMRSHGTPTPGKSGGRLSRHCWTRPRMGSGRGPRAASMNSKRSPRTCRARCTRSIYPSPSARSAAGRSNVCCRSRGPSSS